jgi:hypothetical protein
MSNTISEEHRGRTERHGSPENDSFALGRCNESDAFNHRFVREESAAGELQRPRC